MIYEWDAGKAAANLAKHGVPFDAIHEFDWTTSIERVDDRKEYGELRIIAVGYIDARIHVVVYTPRGDRLRIISLRRASRDEEQIYAKAQKA
jgi:uncharacterized protein